MQFWPSITSRFCWASFVLHCPEIRLCVWGSSRSTRYQGWIYSLVPQTTALWGDSGVVTMTTLFSAVHPPAHQHYHSTWYDVPSLCRWYTDVHSLQSQVIWLNHPLPAYHPGMHICHQLLDQKQLSEIEHWHKSPRPRCTTENLGLESVSAVNLSENEHSS